MSELQLALASVAGGELELVDAELVTNAEPVAPALPLPLPLSPPPSTPGLASRNLFGEAERIAARAASASTRWQYGAIFRAFGDQRSAARRWTAVSTPM